MALLYNIIIHFYYWTIRFASLFNPKARLWLKGRSGQEQGLENLAQNLSSDSRLAWFHCASLGEFEQGRPVLEAFRKAYPEWKILLTFFSPSGYEVRKYYEGADFVFYLPLDSPAGVEKFIDQCKPRLVFFIKYEFWFNYLQKLKQREIPVFIISANFREGQHFFKWYGVWARKQLRNISWFFVQDESSVKLLSNIGINSVSVSGDTRFDRVITIAGQSKDFPIIESFAGRDPVFLAGSSWPADEHILRELIIKEEKHLRFIIAPHEVHEEHIADLEKIMAPYGPIRYSMADEADMKESRVMLIDGIGYLSHLYKYAMLAYIGGGFGSSIHNILEAATFGKPIIIGPKYHKFKEARDLVRLGGAFVIHNGDELISITRKLMDDPDLYRKAAAICSNYVQEKKGATGIILNGIQNIAPQVFRK